VSSYPKNLQAEEAVIAAAIGDPFAIDKILQELSATDFFSRELSSIFSAVRQISSSGGDPSDRDVLMAILTKRQTLELVGIDLLDRLIARSPTSDVGTVINAVKEASTLRQIALIAKRAEELATNSDADTDARALASQMSAQFAKLALRGAEYRSSMAGDIATEVIERSLAVQRGDGIAGYDTPWVRLNQTMGLIEEGEMVVIGARASMGKTAMALQMAAHIAANLNVPTAIASLEMTRSTLVRRLMSQATEIPNSRIRYGMLSDTELLACREQAEIMKKWPLYIESDAITDLDDIMGYMSYCLREFGCRVYVVDYLQLIVSQEDRPNQSRALVLQRMANRIREFGFKYGVNIIVLSQVRREAEKNPKCIPTYSDLLDSGGIEAACAKCLLLCRPGRYNDDVKPEVEDFIVNVDKNKEGPTGKITLGWRGAFGEVVNRNL
jgi:replicative DNA helicase